MPVTPPVLVVAPPVEVVPPDALPPVAVTPPVEVAPPLGVAPPLPTWPPVPAVPEVTDEPPMPVLPPVAVVVVAPPEPLVPPVVVAPPDEVTAVTPPVANAPPDPGVPPVPVAGCEPDPQAEMARSKKTGSPQDIQSAERRINRLLLHWHILVQAVIGTAQTVPGSLVSDQAEPRDFGRAFWGSVPPYPSRSAGLRHRAPIVLRGGADRWVLLRLPAWIRPLAAALHLEY